jgi:diguanylate cyclase (GGDEF)-like protein
MRRLPFVALLVGVVLLAVGLLAMSGALAQERQQQKMMERDALQTASAFGAYFERARSLDLLLAQNPAFRAGASKDIDNSDANRALAYLQRLFPGKVSQAAIITDEGHELARVTGTVPAHLEDLSTTEGENAYFAATLALPEGAVYQGPPYVSSDTKQWVIANSTWIRQQDGRRLIVHFVVSLASFEPYLTNNSANRHLAVIDRVGHLVVLEDNVALPNAKGGQFRSFPAEADLNFFGTRPLTENVNGREFAVGGIARLAGNANDWAIVEWSTEPASFVSPWVGGAGAVAGAVLILLSLLLLRRQNAALQMESRLDDLTGLKNRKGLEEVLDAAVAAPPQPGGERLAVLMLDLDGFKQINDALGHDRGDYVLREMGRRLQANTLDRDIAARLGGDEFAVVLRHLREDDDVSVVAQRLREALVRPVDIDGVARFVGVSIGAAVYGDHGRTSGDLCRASTAAMQRAKRGREGVRVYDAGTEAGANASSLAAELLLAIDREEIKLKYQPEFALDTGRIVGVEALARWHRNDERDIPPMEFVLLAEQTGLIRHLTNLTLRKALDEAQAWQANGQRVPVSVNLSAQLVTDQSLLPDIVAMLAERGLDGDALVLEITETTVIADFDVATTVLRSLRALGIRIELDDFGSGYASFKALYELPLDGVKIDRDLVNDQGAGGQNLLAATIDFGQRRGLRIVAEGIEDEAGLELVRRLGVDTAQGYHLARPMSSEDMQLLLGAEPIVAASHRAV